VRAGRSRAGRTPVPALDWLAAALVALGRFVATGALSAVVATTAALAVL
jgi:hypothetical protein